MGTGDILDELRKKAKKALGKPVMRSTPEEDEKLQESYEDAVADVAKDLIKRVPKGICGVCGAKLTPSECGCLNEKCTNHVGKWPTPGTFYKPAKKI